MSRFRKPGALIVATAVFGLLAMSESHKADASIITVLEDTATVTSGAYAGDTSYTYMAQLTGDQQLDATGGGSPVQFGTVYDFGVVEGGLGNITTTGLIGSGQFVWTIDATDTPGFEVTPVDSPDFDNIRFTYVGSTNYFVNASDFATTSGSPTVQLAATTDNLGTFTVISPFAPSAAPMLQYDGQAKKASNDTTTGNVGLTTGPSLPSPVPEPASMVLLGAGLLGTGLLRRKA